MMCAFCGQPASNRCGLVYPQTFIIFPPELQTGDQWTACDEVKYTIRKIGVGVIRWSAGHMDQYFEVACQTALEPEKVKLWQIGFPGLPLLITRAKACGLPCCELHSVERGENFYLCQNHWLIPEEPGWERWKAIKDSA